MDTATEGENVTLTDFLLARVAEDESNDTTLIGVARKDWAFRWAVECTVKRLTIRFLSDLERGDYEDPTASMVAHSVLCRHAAAYSDHPDFDESWRV